MAKKRTQRELFIDKLSSLSNKGEKLVPNRTLKEALKWTDDKYTRVKEELIYEEAIIRGAGQGGSVGLAHTPDAKALSVFISYSHADEAIKTELIKHLEPLKKLNLIETWHDRMISPGDDWAKTISKNLETADIIILLISIDFINSKYCFDIELEKALELHQEQRSVVVPVIVRNCLWQHTSFAKIQALPKDGKAVKSFLDIDDALTSVVDGIRLVAEQVINRRI
ncbi:toll/interleukin-1 receptor domain-containing protein [Chromobacterium vaccinii]|uniref:toll/interleukin-1 receptor domain-containing protein n=1 Tax=Chromobacterium vaccinii TaxID=1108595 RepID=UPI0032611098